MLASKFGILQPLPSLISLPADQVELEGKSYSFYDFFEQHRLQLVLGITENCNLDCKYCTFGKCFSEYRQHSLHTMPFPVAKKAITDFLDKATKLSSISFYGGEPLLEFDLIKKIVHFGEKYATQLGKRVKFAFTTNGTLLVKEVINFIVEHDINVVISLDGDKMSHDSNRVFKNVRSKKTNLIGSYDTVWENIRLFIERYPQYANRGLKITLTAHTEIRETNECLRFLLPFFSQNDVSFVKRPIENEIEDSKHDDQQSIECLRNDVQTNGNELCRQYHPLILSQKNIPVGVPDFINYSVEFRQQFDEGIKNYLAALRYSPLGAREQFPLFYFFWNSDIASLHHRHLGNDCIPCFFSYKCLPGVVRIFCDPQGNYYPCEKTEMNEMFYLGNVQTGLNVDYAIDLTNRMRQMADCVNCVARRTCKLCLAHLHSGEHEKNLFHYYCRQVKERLSKMLIDYTELMEINPLALDDSKRGNEDTFLSKIRFISNSCENNENRWQCK